jgi:formamidopyrimidine-DNA glycosylase
MPELPEVQTVVTTLQPLAGRRFGRIEVARDDVIRGEPVELTVFAARRTIRSITRQAKRIIFDLGRNRAMWVHLGMTGQLVVKDTAAPLMPHTHVRWRLAGSTEELRFRDPRRFGGIWLVTPSTPRTGRGLGPIGIDPVTMSARAFIEAADRRRQIKALLLDQQIVAGLGNIYADESLYAARIHPLTVASDLDRPTMTRLHRAIQRTLAQAIEAGGSTISDYRNANGEGGWFQIKHKVYGREGAPCRRCKTPIERIQVAGRSSHVCPVCQVR